MANSFIVSCATTCISLVLATLSGYAFARIRMPGGKALLFGILATQMFPGILLAIPLYILMRNLHLLDSLAGLVLVYTTFSLPFCVWMMRNDFVGVPRDLDDAAMVDGTSRLRALLTLVLPGWHGPDPEHPGPGDRARRGAHCRGACLMTTPPEIERGLAYIGAERMRQLEICGVQRHSWVEWIGILAEEFGEASVESNQLNWNHPRASLANLRTELVQTAAVAAAIVDHINAVLSPEGT